MRLTPVRVALTLRAIGVILPWTLALPTGTAQCSITFSHSSCICASLYLCSWKKVQALRVHLTSKLGAEFCLFPQEVTHIGMGWYSVFLRTGGVTAEGSHGVLHRSKPSCNSSSHLCSCFLTTSSASCGSTGTCSLPGMWSPVSHPPTIVSLRKQLFLIVLPSSTPLGLWRKFLVSLDAPHLQMYTSKALYPHFFT